MGIARDWADLALRRCRNNIEIALNMCFEHGAEMAQLVAEDAALQLAQSSRAPAALRRLTNRDEGGEDRRPGLASSVAQFLSRSTRRPSSLPAAENLGSLRQLLDLGFPQSWCDRAMEANGNNTDAALSWILSNGERLVDEETGSGENDSPVSQSAVSSATAAINPLVVIAGSAAISADLICKGASSGFPSVGCKGYAATSGKWYYECTLLTAGCCQVGWADGAFEGNSADGQGVGDDSSSWAFDGYRSMLWHEVSEDWGHKWKVGDVVGLSIDIDNREMFFFLNGFGYEVGMGRAFVNFESCGGLYPAASYNRGGRCQFYET